MLIPFTIKEREEFLGAVRDNQILVVRVVNDFGTTTRFPQYLYEDGSYTHDNNKMIALTQPFASSIAATSLASRGLGNSSTRFMTHARLLHEYLDDHLLVNYSVIVVDQAHERTLHTDLLLALLKGLARRRPDFKLIISTSGFDCGTELSLCTFFGYAPFFFFEQREVYPVQLLNSPTINTKVVDYMDDAITAILHIHIDFLDIPGDILVFLPLEKEEIESAIDNVSVKKIKSAIKIHPDYVYDWGSLFETQFIICPISEYNEDSLNIILKQHPIPTAQPRRVFFAPNNVEASLISTIYGMDTSIKYVVDSGLCKQKSFDPRTGIESLVVVPISDATATRRARAARCGGKGGKCYRLYTYSLPSLPENTLPEIQRTNLANMVLILKSLGIHDLFSFDFVDPPPTESLNKALDFLYALGALDSLGHLTRVGRRMTEFFFLDDPMLSKMIVASKNYNCSEEIITIAAMLSSNREESIFYRPKGKEVQADSAKMRFYQGNVGDHIALLKVYNEWKSCDYGSVWCCNNYIKVRSMKKARDIRNQLKDLLDKVGIKLKSNLHDLEAIKKAFTAAG